MHIASFKLRNYKSFLESEEIFLAPGFNVVVGQNNAGKSALLEGVSLRFESKPHRSLTTSPRPTTVLDASSRADIVARLRREELHDLILDAGKKRRFGLSFPKGATVDLMRRVLADDQFGTTVYVSLAQPEGLIGSFFGPPIEEHRNGPVWAIVHYDEKTRSFEFMNVQDPGGLVKLSDLVAQRLIGQVYTFRAERMNVGRGHYGHDVILSPNAGNLPTVLGVLQANRERYRRYNEAVSTIFPEIQHISVDPDPSTLPNGIQIRVWTVDPATERQDLAIPLVESGTGISQVLAILYVVLTAESPQTIVVDEPQSFLHPGAARKLIEVLKQHPRHQFILTTHSATIITAAQPEHIHLLRKSGGQTRVESIDPTATTGLRTLLSEVGARLTDVFGADNILWVEGPTEEICLPLILGKLLEEPLYGTQIVGVARTGDFEGKHAELVFSIYDKLTSGPGLLPPAFGFMFDNEGRSEGILDQLKKRGEGRVVFTNRRMYENYLLHPEAIAQAANSIPHFRARPLGPEEIADWLDEHRWDRKYLPEKIEEADRNDAIWIQKVHGAKILADIFGHFSDERVRFDKVRDCVNLTRWTLEHKPEELQEFADSVKELRRSWSHADAGL